jgi:hypothetical protein
VSINCIKVFAWLWLLLAIFWLFVLALSIRALLASAGTPAFQYSEWSSLVAGLSLVLLLLFSLSGLALVFRWRFLRWWQIPAALALVGTCYLIWGGYFA